MLKESDLLNNIAGEHQENMMQSGVDAMISTLIDLQDKLYYTKGSHEKAEIKEKIQDIYDAIIEEQLRINPNLLQAYRDSVHEASRPFVLWQLYFPRVFKENGGFDICIGNPPYIQLQKAINDDGTKLGDLYKHLGFTTFVKTGDIYCLFYEKGCGLLKYGGVLSFITSNKWMKSSYGKSLRAYFAKEMRILTLIDLGGGVFETATVDTNILIAEAKPQKQPYLYNALKLNKTQRVDRLRLKDFSEYEMSKEAKPIALVDNALKPIVEKINKNGTLLGEWEIIINRGLVTGLNEAFIIDQEKRDEIIRLEPHAEGIIFPIYRGKDVSRYNSEFHNLYLIYIPWHFPLNEDNITGASEVAEKAFKEQYPVLYAHLLAYKGKLENRNKEEMLASG